MLPINPHICELLASYNCVVVPEWGGFVANRIPARIREDQGRFEPPGRQVMFNPSLQSNDGLLAHKLAIKEAITYQEALVHIREYVLHGKATLQNTGRFEMDQLGIFYLDQEQKMRFQPDDALSILPDAFGLVAFHCDVLKNEHTIVKASPLVAPPVGSGTASETEAKPLRKTNRKPNNRPPSNPTRKKAAPVAAPRSVDPVVVSDHKKAHRRWPVMATAGALLIFGFYYYHIPNHTDYRYSGRFEAAQLLQFGSSPAPTTYQPGTVDRGSTPIVQEDPMTAFQTDEEAEVVVLHLTDDTAQPGIVVRLKEQVPPPPVKKDVAFISGKPNKRLNLRYQLIMGCFANKKNADSLVATLREQGKTASILDYHKGLYRVSAQGYPSRKEARAAKKALKTEGKSSWILKMR